MDIVKCKRCGEMINKKNDEFVKLSSGYAHKICEEQFQIKRNTVICQICRQGINKLTDDYIKKSNGYIHKECSLDLQDKQQLFDYICELFGLKSPGPANLALIKKYYTENKYSYKSMYYALKYYYEVRKNSTEKANKRIGILPFIYDEAKEYYSNLTYTQNVILHNVEKQLEKKESIIIVKQAPKRKKITIDLEDLN